LQEADAMRVTLFFPPHWAPTMPHLALPSLTAYLRQRGIPVTQHDLNVEFFDAVLSRPTLATALATVQRRHRRLASARHEAPLAQAELRHLETILPGASDLVADVDLAKSILRGPQFYEPDENLGAMLTVIDALQLASAPYFPSAVSWQGYQTLPSPDSTRGILRAIADLPHNPFSDFYQRRVIPQLLNEKPGLVGISLSSIHQVVPGLTLAAMIKSLDLGIHVTVGGKMIACWRDRLPANRDLLALFDSAVVGDGEFALAELAESLADGRGLDGVPNLIYRDGDTIRANPVTYVPDLGALPMPCFEGLPLRTYLAPEVVLPIAACRGCYWRRCAFCNLGYGESRVFRARSAEMVAQEMVTQAEAHAARTFFFVDEALPPRLMAELPAAIGRHAVEASWAACARFEPALDAPLLRRLAGAGCRTLMFGLESGSARVLERCRKGTRPDTIRRVLRASARAGIWNHVFVFFGFPGETREEADETTRFVRELLPSIGSVAGGTFVLEQYSDVYEHPEAYGVTRIEREAGSDLAFRYDYAVSEGQTAEQAEDALGRFSEMLEAERTPRVFLDDVYNLLYASHGGDWGALLASED
jgi:anaerobic magnesium-protoporphyrin IX monomethyl ester cyclase